MSRRLGILVATSVLAVTAAACAAPTAAPPSSPSQGSAQEATTAPVGLQRAPVAPTILLDDTFDAMPTGVTYTDGQTFDKLWAVVWAGGGAVTAVRSGSGVLTMAPAAATEPAETHSVLVVSNSAFGSASALTTRVRTVKQLRTGSAPNPWETVWVVWGYTDPEHFYYLALKTNGWELGKRDPAYPGGQRFLATGANKTFPAGTWHDVAVTGTATATMAVKVDGMTLSTFTDAERPYLTGKVGLYSEDAQVQADRVTVTKRKHSSPALRSVA